MRINPFDQAFMHEHHLRLPADLRVDGDGEHEAAVGGALAVVELELLFPEALDDVRVYEAVGRGLRERELEGRPVVEVPVPGDHYACEKDENLWEGKVFLFRVWV